MNISSSKPLSDSDVRSGLKTLSVMLNKRSTGADEDGMARYREARIARFGHFCLFVHQYWRGSLVVLSSGGWERYSSTSDADDPVIPVVTGSSASRKSKRYRPGAGAWSMRLRLAHGCGASLFKRTLLIYWHNESVMAACCVDRAQRSLKGASRTDAVSLSTNFVNLLSTEAGRACTSEVPLRSFIDASLHFRHTRDH